MIQAPLPERPTCLSLGPEPLSFLDWISWGDALTIRSSYCMGGLVLELGEQSSGDQFANWVWQEEL